MRQAFPHGLALVQPPLGRQGQPRLPLGQIDAPPVLEKPPVAALPPVLDAPPVLELPPVPIGGQQTYPLTQVPGGLEHTIISQVC